MLQEIRDRLTGWIVWFVVGLIVIPFAFWGIESFRTGGGDPVVAKVGDQEITQSQFRAGYEQRYQQLQAMMGERFRADMFDQNRFRRAVLDDMTQESMLRQFVRKAGYRANDATLFQYLSNIPAFQENGKFSSDAYKSALARQGMTPERFESQLRDSLEIDQMREAVIETAFVTEADVAQAYRLANQERALAYAVLDYSKYLADAAVTDEQLKARYDGDKAKYMAPERIRLAYVQLAVDALPPAAAPAADVLKVIYNAEKDSRFSTAEERRAAHILVSFGADKAAAKKKIEELSARLKSGADFAELAKTASDDPGSKGQGGELGWVKRGQMVDRFEKALFALKSGDVSAPVETEFGWHLIKLQDVKPAQVKAFEDPAVQKELVEIYQKRDAEKRFQEQSEKLEQLAFENPTSLDAAAKALGLQVQTTEWFTRAGGAGIAAEEAVKQAAFSKEIVSDGDNSKPLPVGQGKVAVIRKAEYEAPRQKPLAEVAEQVRTDLKTEAAKAKAQAEAQQMAAAARAGRPLAELAAARGLALKAPGYIRRDNTAEERAVVDALFRMPRPKNGDVGAADVKLASGGVAVVVLSGVKDPEWPAKNMADVAREQSRLRDALAGADFGGYRKAIEKQVAVKVVNPPVADTAPTPES